MSLRALEVAKHYKGVRQLRDGKGLGQLMPGPWNRIPRSHHGVLQPWGFLPLQQEQLARLIPGAVFGQIPVSEERAWWHKSLPSPDHCFYKCLHFAMSSELSSKIIHGISHLALMSAWHMFTTGTWRTLWTPARRESPHFTVNVKPAAAAWFLQVAARWNSCLPVSRKLGCSSPRFTRTSSRGAIQGGSKYPKAFFAVHHSAHLLPETPWGQRRQAQTFLCFFLPSLFLNLQENIV